MFSSINDSSVMLSNDLKNKLPIIRINGVGKQFVQKYLRLDFFINSIKEKYFYMSAPSKWDDPLETKYLDFLNNDNENKISPEDLKELKNMYIFCSCMTYNDSDNEEASWRSYDSDREQVIRISYDFNKLCGILKKEKIFIGEVKYKPRKEIISWTPVNYKILSNNNNRNEVLFVNNFCYKQDAYRYEKELRFCIIHCGKHYQNLDSYVIKDIDLTPAVIQITLPPINYNKLDEAEKNSKLREQIKMYSLLKKLCPDATICVSNLYNPNEITMTSVFNPKTK